jgi:hypothetical protein
VLNWGSGLPMMKVMDPGACSGSWSGQFVQDGTNVTYQVGMVIGPTGAITSCAGFAAPVEGRFYSQSGHVAGHFTTGESEPGWQEVMLQNAQLLGGVMSGTFSLDCGTCNGGSFSVAHTTGVETGLESVAGLRAPVPNPTRGVTSISYTLGRGGRTELGIYDLTGRLVRRLVDGERGPGTETVVWDGMGESGTRLGAGMYFIRLAGRNLRETCKIILVR